MSFICDICSKVFTEKRALMRHIASAHNNENYDYTVPYAKNRSNEKIIYADMNYLFIAEQMR